MEMLQLTLAGAAGGLLRSLYYRADWKEFVINVVSGALVARYLGPEGPELLRWVIGNVVNAEALKGKLELSGFLLGAGGVAVVGWFYDLIESRIKKGPSNDDQGIV
jgi:hypothetical protein